MKEITEELCIELLKKELPDFFPYWESYLRDFGPELDGNFELEIHTHMIPVTEFAVALIKSNNQVEIKKFFDLIEFLLCNGNESVKNAVATGFLEYLMNKSPEEINFSTFYKYMGENAIGYCRAWDEFNGVKTEGLWDKE